MTRMGLQVHWVRCAAKLQPLDLFVVRLGEAAARGMNLWADMGAAC